MLLVLRVYSIYYKCHCVNYVIVLYVILYNDFKADKSIIIIIYILC